MPGCAKDNLCVVITLMLHRQTVQHVCDRILQVNEEDVGPAPAMRHSGRQASSRTPALAAAPQVYPPPLPPGIHLGYPHVLQRQHA